MLNQQSMRFDGVIKTWNDERGFGFIEASQGGQEIFVHIKAFSARATRPQVGNRVSFEIELGPQGNVLSCCRSDGRRDPSSSREELTPLRGGRTLRRVRLMKDARRRARTKSRSRRLST